MMSSCVAMSRLPVARRRGQSTDHSSAPARWRRAAGVAARTSRTGTTRIRAAAGSAAHVGAATELLLLAGGLGLLRGDAAGSTRHRRHGPAGHAKRDTAHRHDQQLDCELRRHLDLLHADGGEYADLVFAFADVEQIEHDRTDRQYDDEQREGELGEAVERHEARFVVLHVADCTV